MILAIPVRQSIIRLSAILKAEKLENREKSGRLAIITERAIIFSIYSHVGIRFRPINS